MFFRVRQHPFGVFAALIAFLISCGGGPAGLDPPNPNPRITSFGGSEVVTPGHSEEYSLSYIPATTTCTLSDLSGAGQAVQTSTAPTTTRYSYMVPENTTFEGVMAPLKALCTGVANTTPDTETKSVLIAHKAFAQFVAASGQLTRLNYVSTFNLQVSPFTKTCSSQFALQMPAGMTVTGPTISADCQKVSFKLPTMPVGSLVPASGAVPGQERYVVSLSATVATEDPRYPVLPITSVELVAGDPNTEVLTISDVVCADVNDGTAKEIHIRSVHPIFSKGNGVDYVGTMIHPFDNSTVRPAFEPGSESTHISIFMSGCLLPGNYSMGVSNPGRGGGRVSATFRVMTSAAAQSAESLSRIGKEQAVTFSTVKPVQ